VRGLGKGVSGKPYPHLCNARRPRLEPGTFRSQAVRLYRLHQACPSGFPVCVRPFQQRSTKLLGIIDARNHRMLTIMAATTTISMVGPGYKRIDTIWTAASILNGYKIWNDFCFGTKPFLRINIRM